MLTALLFSITVISGCVQQYTPPQDFPEIKDCVMGVAVDFSSNTTTMVRSATDVGNVFNEFIQYSEINNQGILGYDSSLKWKYVNSTIHGTYGAEKYWKVNASILYVNPQRWISKEVFDVSENGEVVRLLGCI